LELRVPFLDHRLVEFAARLPPDLKLSGGHGKFLLRQAMRDVLPQQIVARPKKGFPVPTRQWFRMPLSGFVRESLLARDSACRDYFDCSVIDELLCAHEKGLADRQQEIWTLLVFELWHRLFLKPSGRPASTTGGRRPEAGHPREISRVA
ncbi:MAG: asparagine synthetase B, partial [Acidobacteria bacterium]|nr:asparagine synthetase B [Acidobacteriota bacterium]